MQIFNDSFKSAVGRLGVKECEASSDVNENCTSKEGVDVAIKKYKDHPSIKMINESISFESRFSFKEIRESDIQKEVSNLNSKKAGTFWNISTKVHKDSSDICNDITGTVFL